MSKIIELEVFEDGKVQDEYELLQEALRPLIEKFGHEKVLRALGATVQCPKCGYDFDIEWI